MRRPRTTSTSHPTSRLVGNSPAMAALREQIRRLAPHDTVGNPRVPTLLLYGETGTGKSLVARVMHESGPRASGPFIAVNCATIPEHLAETELFGHEAGAYTDAKQARAGFFEAASGGTLFLDEVDTLPLAVQAKLLTAIEDKHIRRVGARTARTVDVKIIAATKEALAALAATGRFREDLYHRLTVVVLTIPPLRDHGDDIILIAEHCLREYAAGSHPPRRLNRAAQAWLKAQPWPGNVRELQHVLERATLLHPDVDVLNARLLEQLSVGQPSLRPAAVDEEARLRQALEQTEGNVVAAAERLGLTRSAMRYRMDRYGMTPTAFRTQTPAEGGSSPPDFVDRLSGDPPPRGPSLPSQHTLAPVEPYREVWQAEVVSDATMPDEDTPSAPVLTPALQQPDFLPGSPSLPLSRINSGLITRRPQAAPPFIGRQEELNWYAHTLVEVRNGKPRVVLIPGEAGIGKTRLLYEVQALARQGGMQVYHGRCDEDVLLPYLPFVEALRTQLEQSAGQATDTGATETELLRQLLPRTVEATAVPSAFETVQADQDRLRLFLDVSRALLSMAQRTPLLFTVDDLHWADPSSLDLFQHLVFTLADTAVREPVPLWVIATYRPQAGMERLSRLLFRIQRESLCYTFPLQGLDENAIHTLLQSFGLPMPSHQLTATISQATQGNPLFIQAVFHHMVQHHKLEERGGYMVTTDSPADLHLPEEVTQAFDTRMQALSEDCRRVLTLVALLGERVSLQLLKTVSGMGEEALLDALDAGLHQHLLQGEGQDIWFAHPLIRHVFYQALSPVRRQRLHQQIAQMLERLYGNSRDMHLREIAHHFVRAGQAAAPETVVVYARQAGDQAFMAAAWHDAAQYYEAALAAAEAIPNFPISDRAELLYRAGLARYRDMDVGPALDHYDKAITAYRLAGDLQGLARALMEKVRTRYTLASVPLGTLVDVKPLEATLAALSEHETELYGNILTVMSGAYSTARQQDKARECAQHALEIGQHLQDDRLCAYAYFVLGVAQSRSLHVREGIECLQKALALARRCDDLILQNWPLTRLPLALMRLGRLPEVETVSQEACILTRKYQDWAAYSVASSALTSVAVAKGDLAAAERYAHETMLMVSRSHYPWGGVRALYALACAHTLRGAWTDAEAILDKLIEPGMVFPEPGAMVQTTVHVLRQLVRTYAGQATEVPVAYGMDAMLNAEADLFALDPLCALVELADLCRVPAIAEQPSQVLQQAIDQGHLFSIGWVCLLPRVLGVAAALQQQWDVAETHFQTALEAASRLEARLEMGRTYLDYARMLAARGSPNDRARAMALADQARTLLTALGLPPLVQRAAALALAL